MALDPSSQPVAVERLSLQLRQLSKNLRLLESSIDQIQIIVHEPTSHSSPSSSSSSTISLNDDEQKAVLYLGNKLDLRFQLHLRSISDLHTLLSKHLPPQTKKDYSKPARQCTVFLRSLAPKQCIAESEATVVKYEDCSPLLSRLSDQLLQIYLSPCFFAHQPVDREGFYHRLRNGETEPALLYSALGWAALHAYMCHPQICKRDTLLCDISIACLDRAKEALEVDEPSMDGILALINLSCFLALQGQWEAQSVYIAHATNMARAIDLEWEDPDEVDPFRAEARRRLWWTVCMLDFRMVLHAGACPHISPRAIQHVTPPAAFPDESEAVRTNLVEMVRETRVLAQLLEFTDLDPSLCSDAELLTTVAEINSLLQHYWAGDPYAGESLYLRRKAGYSANIDYYSYSVELWWRLLQPELQTRIRLEESVVLKECMISAFEIIRIFELAVKEVGWCGVLVVSAFTTPIRALRRCALSLPDRGAARASAQALVHIYHLVNRSPMPRCGYGRRLMGILEEILGGLVKEGLVTESEIQGRNAATSKPPRPITILPKLR
ncbi:uncharacterized protein VTP21DRAFT_10674 [Calcarisporiella thermophila]|uniref:uncharacterized protein n=1 Tax=Calcarisporiella thermophila TaxID=911321 RepID=UPI0037421197